MSSAITIEPYSSEWFVLFGDLGRKLRAAIGDTALRIDHIGSTSIPGLAAKPILDIQISVATFEPLSTFRLPLELLGFVFRAENPELTKRYFREPPGERETHIHVRQAGSFSEQFPLLFRDYLRCHPDDARDYAELKRRLAKQFGSDRQGYADAKDEFIWHTIRQADRWAQETGWQVGPSDA